MLAASALRLHVVYALHDLFPGPFQFPIRDPPALPAPPGPTRFRSVPPPLSHLQSLFLLMARFRFSLLLVGIRASWLASMDCHACLSGNVPVSSLQYLIVPSKIFDHYFLSKSYLSSVGNL